jgi:FkbM family methyltransferase
VKRLIAKRGYRLQRGPRSLFERPESLLRITLEMIVLPYAVVERDFAFIQVGSHDGGSNDPIRRLIVTLGWKGVLIEPQPEVFDQLVASYRGCGHRLAFENAAVATEDGNKTLYRIRPDAPGMPSWSTQLASFDLKTILHHRRLIPDIAKYIEEVTVPCVTLQTVASRHGFDKIDLLQIDAEGYDAEIIKAIPFATMRPRFIAFEHKHLSPSEYDTCCRSLIDHDYCLALGSFDTYAVSREIAVRWVPAD